MQDKIQYEVGVGGKKQKLTAFQVSFCLNPDQSSTETSILSQPIPYYFLKSTR